MLVFFQLDQSSIQITLGILSVQFDFIDLFVQIRNLYFVFVLFSVKILSTCLVISSLNYSISLDDSF